MGEARRRRFEQVLQRLCEVAADISGQPRSEITPSSRISDVLEMDSLNTVQLVMAVEDEFGIASKTSEFEVFSRSVVTFEDLAKALLEDGP
ncbi:MAG TPA: phosphopantetheine-binding protein [Fimbriimonas sp.]|nr:phosphopantetheine-binding protein [Fimbriimonas sp.]